MKIYEFKILIWSLGFVLIVISIFIYGLIWLNDGFKIDDSIAEIRKEFNSEINSSNNILKQSIMPSAFKEINKRRNY